MPALRSPRWDDFALTSVSADFHSTGHAGARRNGTADYCPTHDANRFNLHPITRRPCLVIK